ncbi:hypothetical protein [Roseimicrobium sp. ORNL1]|uniref:hypothetical protein n=1 Tax=Roseimicrobium sp. ORNL1 TaxID=2711231 RepID=UPI001980F256|nr:hypothetical protein [Roseimicrobium sp. ORNL1]
MDLLTAKASVLRDFRKADAKCMLVVEMGGWRNFGWVLDPWLCYEMSMLNISLGWDIVAELAECD